jgi:hypothetical protein
VQIDPDALPGDPEVLQEMQRTLLRQQGELHAENDRLRPPITRLSRHQFGRCSEQLTDEPLQLGLEDLEQTVAENEAKGDNDAQEHAADHDGALATRRARRPARNHGALPAHMPRHEVVITAPSQARRRGVVITAAALARPIDGGVPTEALIAHVLVSKFCDSLPLHRQAQMLARQGMEFDRSTLSHWVGHRHLVAGAAVLPGGRLGAVRAEAVRR